MALSICGIATSGSPRHISVTPSCWKARALFAVESDRRFELNLGVVQPVLNSVEHPHRKVRHRVVHLASESFTEHLLGSRFIPLHIVAESEDQIIDEDRADADPRCD